MQADEVTSDLFDGVRGPVQVVTDDQPASPFGDVDVAHRATTFAQLRLELDRRPAEALGPGDAVAVPAGLDHALTGCSGDLELLEVTLPDRPAVSRR